MNKTNNQRAMYSARTVMEHTWYHVESLYVALPQGYVSFVCAFCSYAWTLLVPFDTKKMLQAALVRSIEPQHPYKGNSPLLDGLMLHCHEDMYLLCVHFARIHGHSGCCLALKTGLISGFWSLLEKRQVGGAPLPLFLGV